MRTTKSDPCEHVCSTPASVSSGGVAAKLPKVPSATTIRKALSTLVVLLLSAIGVIAADNRRALIVGNWDYTRLPPLRNPGNDADDMADLLANMGFQPSPTQGGLKAVNVSSKDDFLKILGDFGKGLNRDSIAVFYYSGHGVEFAGKNYLLPTRISLPTARDIEAKGVELSAVTDPMSIAKVGIIILDACRSELVANGGKAVADFQGLGPVIGAKGTFIAYPTAPEATASDGKGRNGLFTKHVLQWLSRPGLGIETIFKRVREDVIQDPENAGGWQIPWDASCLVGDFYLIEPPSPTPTPTPTSTPEVAPPQSQVEAGPAVVAAPPTPTPTPAL
jgi:uncharacterized protein